MKKRVIGFVAACLSLALIVGSWAFYTSTNTVDNRLKTSGYGDEIREKFTPKTFQPGDEVTKEAGVKNTGDTDLVVRFKLNEQWWRDANNNNQMDPGEEMIAFDSTGNNGADSAKINYTTNAVQGSTTDGLLTGDQTVVKKTLDLTGWTKGSDGYWYYNTKLNAKASTNNFIKSIMLATDADMGKKTSIKYWTENAALENVDPVASNIGTDSTTKWVVYTGEVPSPTVATNNVYTRAISGLDPAASGYSNAVYDLFITCETCQATDEAVTATWDMTAADLAAIKTGWAL